jgi:Protein kinase domain/PEGA domain
VNGRYQLGRMIGGGGMAEVFEAIAHGAEGFARPVAIKRMLPALSLDAAFGQMFVNEARIASLLHHENIVSTLDFDRDPEGRYFIVMELVRGIDLRKLASAGALPWGVIVFILTEVLNGLGYAHELEQGGRALRIVHRDVSPHNVMVSWDGAVKVVDFGIAKAVAATGASRSNTLKGKMAYMSPEQAHGLDLDGRADVFAVGVMGYELITGQRLFPGQTEVEILARLLTQPIPWPRQSRPDVPADLEAVVMRMLERDRDARPTALAAQEGLLATREVDPRAQIALRELLRQRFPDAPRRRGESQPGFAALPGGPVPLADSTLTAPQSGTARAVMAAETRTGASGATGGRRRTAMWVALALVLSAAAIIVAVVVTSGGGGGGSAAAAPPDAAAVAAAPPDAAPAPVDASTLAIAAPPPDAAGQAPARHHHHHVDAGIRGNPVSHPPAAPPDAAPPPPPDAAPPRPDAAPARPGTLSVRVTPWAYVFVDGKRLGQTPVTHGLPPGPHAVRLVNDALGQDETSTVLIESGRTATVRRHWQADD